MANNLLDLALLLQIGEALPCQGAVDLKSVDQDGNGHEAVGLDILVELLRGRLVQDDGVLGLVLDCAFVSRCSECVVPLRISSSPSTGSWQRPVQCISRHLRSHHRQFAIRLDRRRPAAVLERFGFASGSRIVSSSWFVGR